MAKNNFADLSVTSASNTDFIGQSTAGSANVSTLDTIVQNFAAMAAKFYDDIGATGTVGGTADAITLTSGSVFQSLAAGNVVAFKAGSANTGAATINVDALGAKAIRRQGDSALAANDILANGVYMLRYDTAYNGAAGAWVLLNPSISSSLSAATTTNVLTGTDASAYATSDAIAALWEKGSDVASAGTVSLGEGGFFHITGTTTITDIDFTTAKNGRAAILIFDSALTLTHNATTLLLPGAANITTATGDRCCVVQDSSDNVYVVWYQRAGSLDGQPVPTSSTLAIGSLALCEYLSSTALTNGSATAGTNLKLTIGDNGGSFTPGAGAAQTGTWTNVSGATLDTDSPNDCYGYFVRTA